MLSMAAPAGNIFALGNEGGRPPKYENAAEMQAKILEYFEYIKGDGRQEITVDATGEMIVKWERPPEPATITGLTLYLGFADRQSLYDYQKNEEFSCTIKIAKTMVECEYEKKLAFDKPTGAIFALKNMGWADRMETNNTTHNTGSINLDDVQFDQLLNAAKQNAIKTDKG